MEKVLSRREFARAGLGAVASAIVGCAPRHTKAVKAKAKSAPPPFTIRLGLQSYSLRSFRFEDAVAKLQQLGLHYVEMFPRHLPQNLKPQDLAARLASLKAAAIKVNGYGVCGIGKNEAGIRALFGFAKKVGIEVVAAAPAPDALPVLDKLVAEYDIKIGIHNHGPGDKTWGKLQQLLDGTKDHHPNIGVCLDTGHLFRSGDDPIEAVRRLGPRLHSLHFKDVNAQGHDVVVGTGTLDLGAFLSALREVGFDGPFSLEFELNPKDPVPGIAQSLAAIRRAAEKVGATTI